MFGAAPLAVSLLVSSVFAAVVAPLPPTVIPGPGLHCGPVCVDTIPLNPRGKCVDFFKEGPLISEFRDVLRRCCANKKEWLFMASSSKILNFGVCGIGVSFEQYKCSVYETIRCLACKPSFKENEELNRILCHIYNAAEKKGVREQDLLIFTSIAMHNHNYLTRFPSKDTNTSFDCVCRGLMQIKSKEYYEKLNNSPYNYITEPWRLNCFDATSISDEFGLYWNEFRHSKPTDNITAMTYSIKAMASIEGQLLSSINTCYDFIKIADKTIRMRLLRRYEILCKLGSFMCMRESFCAVVTQ